MRTEESTIYTFKYGNYKVLYKVNVFSIGWRQIRGNYVSMFTVEKLTRARSDKMYKGNH